MRTAIHILACLLLPLSAHAGDCPSQIIGFAAGGTSAINTETGSLYLSAPDHARVQITTGDGQFRTLRFSFSAINNMITLTPAPDTPAPTLTMYALPGAIFYCPDCYRIRLPAYWHPFTTPIDNSGCRRTRSGADQGGAA